MRKLIQRKLKRIVENFDNNNNNIHYCLILSLSFHFNLKFK